MGMDRVAAPLVIGVTGHRDLRPQDIESLEKQVRRIFLEFRRDYPSTPLTLLSPLAEGADRLVARVALEAEIGARLVVPLPMPQALYKPDFKAPGSLEEFDELLDRADYSFELPILPDADEETVRQEGPARDRQYEAVGKYIATESQILIALWDGVDLGKVGGTAAIVKFQTEGPDRHECDLLPPELFPTYHVVTPRQKNPAPESTPFECKVRFPSVFEKRQDAEKYYSRIFGNLDRFNRDIARGGKPLACEANQSKRYVISDSDERKLSESESWTLARYAIADSLAIRFQKRMTWMHRFLHWSVFLSFLGFVLFAHWPDPEKSPGFLGASLTLLLLGFLSYRLAKRRALDDKRQDYRAVAEGCRVRFFWQIANVRDAVPKNYLGQHRTELDWIRNGLRGWEIGLDSQEPNRWQGTEDRVECVFKQWVCGEQKFFEQAIERSEKKFEFMEQTVSLCLLAAIALAGRLLLAVLVIEPEAAKSHGVDYLVIVIDLLLAAGALLHHANERMAHSEHIKQYKRMLGIFGNASRTIRKMVDEGRLDAAHTCFHALGREALRENGDWVLLHR